MSDPNFSSFEAFLAILWPGNTLIGKRSQSYTTQCGEIGQFFKIFKMLLEFHKTYKNTCMLQISAQLEHLWPFYGHFRINFGPSREWYLKSSLLVRSGKRQFRVYHSILYISFPWQYIFAFYQYYDHIYFTIPYIKRYILPRVLDTKMMTSKRQKDLQILLL